MWMLKAMGSFKAAFSLINICKAFLNSFFLINVFFCFLLPCIFYFQFHKKKRKTLFVFFQQTMKKYIFLRGIICEWRPKWVRLSESFENKQEHRLKVFRGDIHLLPTPDWAFLIPQREYNSLDRSQNSGLSGILSIKYSSRNFPNNPVFIKT